MTLSVRDIHGNSISIGAASCASHSFSQPQICHNTSIPMVVPIVKTKLDQPQSINSRLPPHHMLYSTLTEKYNCQS